MPYHCTQLPFSFSFLTAVRSFCVHAACLPSVQETGVSGLMEYYYPVLCSSGSNLPPATGFTQLLLVQQFYLRYTLPFPSTTTCLWTCTPHTQQLAIFYCALHTRHCPKVSPQPFYFPLPVPGDVTRYHHHLFSRFTLVPCHHCLLPHHISVSPTLQTTTRLCMCIHHMVLVTGLPIRRRRPSCLPSQVHYHHVSDIPTYRDHPQPPTFTTTHTCGGVERQATTTTTHYPLPALP